MMIKKIILLGLVCLLIVPIINAEIIWGETNSRINLNQGYFCPSPYTNWINTNDDSFKSFSTVPPVYDCRDPISGPSCCPVYSICQKTNNVNTLPLDGYSAFGYSCFVSRKLHCSQFTDKSSCEDESTISLAKESIENNPDYGKGYCDSISNVLDDGTNICWDETFCECVWNEDKGCLAEARTEKDCDNTNPPVLEKTCDYKINYDDSLCDEPEGTISATWELVVDSSDRTCIPGNSYEIPCADLMKLGFFTWINAIIVIVILVVIYYLLISKKKKKKK